MRHDIDDDGDGGFFDRALEQHDRLRVSSSRPAVERARWWRRVIRRPAGR